MYLIILAHSGGGRLSVCNMGIGLDWTGLDRDLGIWTLSIYLFWLRYIGINFGFMGRARFFFGI